MKDKYIEITTKQSWLPIFIQPWWLDAVCQSDYWDVAIYKKGDNILGCWPYFKTEKIGFEMAVMPKLTKFLGIYLFYPDNFDISKKLSYEKEVVDQLSDQVSNFKHLNQNFHYSFNNWLPLYWKKYSQTTQYSYVIKDCSNLDLVYDKFKPSLKKHIKKAGNQLHIFEDDNIEELHTLVSNMYNTRGKKTPYTLDLLKRIDTACDNHNCRKIFYAKNNEGVIIGGIYFIWDQQSVYYLIGGFNSKFKTSNASSALMWEGIKLASSLNKSFDFEGSMIESIERFFRTFGAEQIPYFKIKKHSSKLLKAYFGLKEILIAQI